LESITVLALVGLTTWILLSLTLLGALVYLFPTLQRLRRIARQLDRILDRSEGRVAPVLEHIERVTDNAEYVTTAVRVDVESLGDTVEQASRSARRMLDMVEERVSDLAGFLEVVQEEAEDTFIATASTLRTLRGAVRDRSDSDEGRRSA
jgi:histidine ammonia-lyase